MTQKDKTGPAVSKSRPGFRDVFISFVKIGTLLLGGGYVMLPLLEDEIVKHRKWVTSAEMTDFFALAQVLPGVIAVNAAMLVGNRLCGFTGNIAAALGTIFVPFILIVAYAVAYSGVHDFPFVLRILEGARPAVAGMILGMGINMLVKASKSGWAFSVALLSAGVVLFWNPNVIWIILVTVAAGLIWNFIAVRKAA